MLRVGEVAEVSFIYYQIRAGLPHTSVCQNVLSSKGHDSARLSLLRGPSAFAGFSNNVNIAEHIQKLRKYDYRF